MLLNIPNDFLCPITQEVMIDPVTTSDGQTYEREAIEKWLQKNNTSPLTGLHLNHKVLTPNVLVKKLIFSFVETNKKAFEEELIIAAHEGEEDSVNQYLKLGVNIEAVDNEGRTVLYTAARAGHESVVKLLLNKGAKIEAKRTYGWTPLLCAISNRHLGITKLLLEKGANLEANTDDGSTGLHQAAFNGDIELVKLLLEKGANFNALSTSLSPPGVSVSSVPAAPLPAFKAPTTSFTFGSISTTPSLFGSTSTSASTFGSNRLSQNILASPTPPPSIHALHQAAFKGHTDVVKLLLDKGANIEVKNSDGNTALLLAAWEGHTETAKLLIDRQANIHTKNNIEKTALHLAAATNQASTIQLLIEKGFNIHAKDNNGDMPLHRAAYNGADAAALLLLNEGANYKALNNYNQTPSAIADSNCKWDTSRLIIAKGKEFKQLTILKVHQHVRTIKTLHNTIDQQSIMIKELQKQIDQLSVALLPDAQIKTVLINENKPSQLLSTQSSVFKKARISKGAKSNPNHNQKNQVENNNGVPFTFVFGKP